MKGFDPIIDTIRKKLGFWDHPKKGTQFTNCVLLFAFNGTGKTRLSYEFAHKDRVGDIHHTLYYNAFTEDLFRWHNDLERYPTIYGDQYRLGTHTRSLWL